MLRSVSRLGSCARAAIAPFLASLALAPAVAAPVGQTLASTPLPAEINDAHTLAIDPAGQLWVIDTGQHRLHRLTRSGTNSDLNLDLNAVSPGALDVDAGPDGQFYITDPGTGVWVLNRGLVSDGLLFTPSDIGASAIDGLAVDPEGSLWILDGTEKTVTQTSLDGSSVLGGFTLNSSQFSNPVDIEIQSDGTLWILNGAGSQSTLHHLNRNGTPAPVAPVIPVGDAQGFSEPKGIAIDSRVNLHILDSGAKEIVAIAGPPPVLTEAIMTALMLPVHVLPGDEIVLIFDRPVTLTSALTAANFSVSGGLSTLGNITASQSTLNPREIRLRLNGGNLLTVLGEGALSTAIDLASGSGAIVDRETGVAAVPSRRRDLKYATVPLSLTIVGPGGGSIGVLDSADARYTRHSLNIAAGALGLELVVGLTVPALDGVPGAVQLFPPTLDLLNGDSTLTLQYIPPDLDNGDTGDELRMWIHQIVDNGDGTFDAIPLPGPQTVDPANNTVTARLPRSASSASEPGASSSAAPSPEEGDPPPGTYATLPLDTVDERTVTLAASNGDPSDPSFGPQTSGAGAEAVLTPGPEGTYTLHRIVFPGYEEALEGVSVTIREANLFERYGFPQQSGAIFTLEAEGDDFTLPVALDVEFRTDPTDGDVVTLEGDPGDVTKMRLLRRLDIGAPLEFVTGIEQGVSSPTVWTFGATPLTQQGLGVYGVVVNPDETGPTSGLVFR